MALIRVKRGAEQDISGQYTDGKVPIGEPIFSTDTNDFFVGNGSDIAARFSSQKDVVFVLSSVGTGIQKVQIPFPYKGKVNSITTNVPQAITGSLVFDIECLKNSVWQTVSEITLDSLSSIPNKIEFAANQFVVDKDSPLRINVKSNTGGVANLTTVISIATVI